MNNLISENNLATLRKMVDHFGQLPKSYAAMDVDLREANQKCLDDLAFIIGKATRNEDESPIVRATVAPRIAGRTRLA